MKTSTIRVENTKCIARMTKTCVVCSVEETIVDIHSVVNVNNSLKRLKQRQPQALSWLLTFLASIFKSSKSFSLSRTDFCNELALFSSWALWLRCFANSSILSCSSTYINRQLRNSEKGFHKFKITGLSMPTLVILHALFTTWPTVLRQHVNVGNDLENNSLS